MSVYTLNIDVDNKKLLPARSGGAYAVPSFALSDTVELRLSFLRQNSGVLNYIDYSNDSIKVAVGATAATPSDGEFRLTWNGATSSAISYNATTSQIQTALATVVSNTVTALSGVSYGWLVTMTTSGIFTGTTAGLGGDAFTLYPNSSVLIGTDRAATGGVQMRQTVRLVQQPAAYSDSFTNSQTTGGATLTQVQSGTATQSAIYALKVDNDVYSGQYTLIFGNQAVGLPFNAADSQIQDELSKLTGIGKFFDNNSVTRANVEVDGANGNFGITFVGNLSNTNITSAFSVNDSALIRPPFKVGVLTLNTSALGNILRTAPNTELFFEVEVVQGGNRNTVFSEAVTIDGNPIIVSGSAVPADQASYYTKAEANSVFVEDSTSNVDATNRRLKNSGGTTIVDYGASLFGSGGMVNLSASQVTIGAYPVYVNSTVTATGAVSFGGGMAVSGNLGFFGTVPTAQGSGINIANAITKSGIISFTQPTQANVISNVISLGLIPSSATYGVLPSSPRTLTTTASISFGTIGGNDTVTANVTITGASINDIVLIGLPSSVCPGLGFFGHVISADTIEIDAINGTNSSQTQSAQTFRISVIGY